jgi:anti-sigma factor RsiW
MNNNDSHHDHQNCLMLFERLSEYIDRELDAPTCKEIEAHIKACKPCQICMQTLKQTVNLCRNLERHKVPDTFSNQLQDAVSKLMQTPSDTGRTRFLPEDVAPPAELADQKK